MGLVSFEFAALLAVLLLVYYLLPVRHRWRVLLVGSYVFYLANSAGMTVFLLVTTVTTFCAGRRLGRINEETRNYLAAAQGKGARKEYKQSQQRRKRRVVLAAVLCNIGLLVVLKYTGFLFESANALLQAIGIGGRLPDIGWLLPLGISFYTLQAVGYVIDIYRGKYEPDQNLAQYMLFVSFFPQMIQGPISRHDQLAHQLYEGHVFDYRRVTMGAQLVLWGLIKKFVLAERLAVVANGVFDNYLNYAGLSMLIGAAVYGVQVYADFSGGMDLVGGIAQLFGIEITENFARPYFARSLEEFWRRWHITLGAWMRDYVFYPVSLSKTFARLGKRTKTYFGAQTGKRIPTFLAMFLTFLLVGVWHGAEWKYVAYGIWNASIISSSILLQPVYGRLADACHIKRESPLWRLICMARTFCLVSLGRFFARGTSLHAALVMLKSAFTVWNPEVLTNGTFLFPIGLLLQDWLVILFMVLLLLAVGLWQERGICLREAIAGQRLPVRWAVYVAGVLLLVLFGMYGPDYEAASFVYQQF